VTLTFGQPGKGGTGSVNGADGLFPVMTFSGGTGATPACIDVVCGRGGNGGSFTFVLKAGVPPLPPGVSVVLDAFGSGGYGSGACGSAGLRGGKGGDLHDDPKVPFALQDGSFNGGDGGPGTPPGAGGEGGTYNQTQIGSNGAGGTQC
jgi:hypothetical protein